ncbi:MAG: hypothetical protein SFY96_01910 [Planctomycetota bacterium]|nr:hypothetical protein [Planctomycetota bacterium]
MTTAGAAKSIDELMERASVALADAAYFDAESLALRALKRARAADDFERVARIALPLQEARRQKRQLAIDSGVRMVLERMPRPKDLLPGCYLVQPPMIGVEARDLRLALDAKKISALVICREPMTRAGQWPVVGVSGGSMMEVVSLRVRIAPPPGVSPADSGITRDTWTDAPSASWFETAAEALGDEALARVVPSDPAAWRVDDLLTFLDAHPDHEKLHQRLHDAARAAMFEPVPEQPKRKFADERSF